MFGKQTFAQLRTGFRVRVRMNVCLCVYVVLVTRLPFPFCNKGVHRCSAIVQAEGALWGRRQNNSP